MWVVKLKHDIEVWDTRKFYHDDFFKISQFEIGIMLYLLCSLEHLGFDILVSLVRPITTVSLCGNWIGRCVPFMHTNSQTSNFILKWKEENKTKIKPTL